MAAAFVFPGQGSQSVGMGKGLADAFAAARQVFEEVDAALGERLSAIMWDGPVERLTLTENAQPALMAVSLAALRVLETDAGVDLARDAAFVAGHSLGEYSALAAAHSLTIADAARLLRIRGRAMQKAVPVGAGAMAALIGVDLAQARVIAAEAGGICATANDNGGGQVVLSGEKAAVERAVQVAKAKGVKRAMMLPVSAPFHCPLMRPAAEAMAEALSRVAVRPPRVPLVANVARRTDQRSGRHRSLPNRASDGYGPLAQIGPLHGASGRDYVLRDRHRQGACRLDQTHRRNSHGIFDRHARGHHPVQD